MKIKSALAVLFILVANALLAQDSTVAKSITGNPSHYYYYLNNQTPIFLDTALVFRDYEHLNLTQRNEFGLIQYSNMGLGYNKVWFQSDNRINTRFGFNHYEQAYFQDNTVKYYDVKAPYTEAYYLPAYERGQIFSIEHTQNITPRWNVAIDYNRLSSLGIYTRQQARQENLMVSTQMSSKNKRYRLYGNVLSQTVKNEENGGIANDSIFEADDEPDRGVTPINLENAFAKYRSRQIFVKHHYDLGKTYVQQINDSTTKDIFVSRWRFGHEAKYQYKAFSFRDESPDSAYYTNFFINGAYTDDRSYMQSIQNEVSFQSLATYDTTDNLRPFQLYVAAQHERVLYNYSDKKEDFENLLLKARIFNDKTFKFQYNAGMSYTIQGEFKNAYKLDGTLAFEWAKGSRVKVDAAYLEQAPTLLQLRYASNHFEWQNNFDFVKTLGGGIALESEKLFNFKANFFTVDNYVYFNENSQPTQDVSGVSVFTAYIQRNIPIGDFNFNNKVLYQNVLDGDAIVRVPDLTVQSSFYYGRSIFKKAMDIQVGVQLNYFTSYFADAYNPALSTTHIQNEREIGDYPQFDAFLNIKIRHTKFFLKYEHFNQGLSGNDFYATLHQPLPDAIFKAGIIWKFFD